MVEISKSGSGEGPGGVIPRGYSTIAEKLECRHQGVIQLSIAQDADRPSSVIRFRMLQAISASVFCAFG